MSDPPQLQPYTSEGEKAVLRDMARTCNAVFLGEHVEKGGGGQGADEDQTLALRVVEALGKYKPRDASLVLGLEAVQQKFQPALDAYVADTGTDLAAADARLRQETEWDERASVPFEACLPLLHRARGEGIKLLGLGLESEALAKVRQVGLEGLGEEERGRYVADPSGFIQSVKAPAFKLYAERFIMPSFAARAATAVTGGAQGGKGPSPGMTPAPLSAAKFLAARILWDESMSTAAIRHLKTHPKDLVVLLVGADHIKFGLGAPARLERLLRSAEVETAPGRGKVKSILLNPTPADTGSETRRLRLSLGYANNLANCRPVADFLWWSQYPRVAWLEHPQNPISSVYSEDDTLFQVFSGRK